MPFDAGSIAALMTLNTAMFSASLRGVSNEIHQFHDKAQHDLQVNIDDSPLKQFSNTAKQVGDDAGGAAEGVEAAGGAMEGAGALAAGAAVAFAAVVAALYGIAKGAKSAYDHMLPVMTEIFHRNDDIHDLATNVGISSEQLSRFGFAAEQSGASTEEMAEAFKFLAKNVYDATQGNKDAIATFNKFGIAFQDAAGNARPLDEVMLDVADAIQKSEPGAQRVGAAMELISARSTKMIATLADGSAALRAAADASDDYGYTLSTSAANDADKFGDLLGEARAAWTGVKSILAQDVIIALTPKLEELLGWVRTHGPEIREIVERISEGVVYTLDLVAEAIEKVATLAETRLGRGLIGAAIGEKLLGPLGGIGGFFAGVTSDEMVTGRGIGVTGGGKYSFAPATFNLPAFDTRESSSQIAAKLAPIMRDHYEKLKSQAEMQAQMQAIYNGF